LSEIRNAEAGDLDRIVELWIQLARMHEELSDRFKLVPNAVDVAKTNFAKAIHAPDRKIIIAIRDGAIVGFVNGSIGSRPAIFADRRHGNIDDLFVEEAQRRRGMGAQLVSCLMDWFRAQGITSVQTQFYIGNRSAKAFWGKLGFRSSMSKVEREVSPA